MTNLTTVSILRDLPTLSLQDTVGKGLALLRRLGVPALAVVWEGRPIGIFSEAALLPLLSPPYSESQWGTFSALPVAEVMSSEVILGIFSGTPLTQVAETLRARQAECAPVTTPEGYYAGLVFRQDVVAALCNVVSPGTVGGMATPLGVYLTNGKVRAGAGDVGLVLTGVFLAFLMQLSSAVVSGICLAVQHYTSVPLLAIRYAAGTYLGSLYFTHLEAWVALIYALQFSGFFFFMRVFALSGTHGAEHQVVHTIEACEELTPQNVLSHTTVHPRCGTNLAAMMLVIGIGIYYLTVLNLTNPLQLIIYALAVIILASLLRRQIGAFLQRFLTTRRPSEKQVLAAIQVGKQLLERCRFQGEQKAGSWERLWNMGLLQILTGAIVTIYLTQLLQEWLGKRLPI